MWKGEKLVRCSDGVSSFQSQSEGGIWGKFDCGMTLQAGRGSLVSLGT